MREAFADHAVGKWIALNEYGDEELNQGWLIKTLRNHYREHWNWVEVKEEKETLECLVMDTWKNRLEQRLQEGSWANLGADELGSILLKLSFDEWKCAGLTCKRWRRVALQKYLQRLRVRTSQLRYATDKEELVRFIETNRICHFARCSIAQVVQLRTEPWLSRVQSLRVDLKGLHVSDLEVVFSLPNLKELGLFVDGKSRYLEGFNTYGHMLSKLERLELVREGGAPREYLSCPKIPPNVTWLLLHDVARSLDYLFARDGPLPTTLTHLSIVMLQQGGSKSPDFMTLPNLKSLELLHLDQFGHFEPLNVAVVTELFLCCPSLQRLVGPFELESVSSADFPLCELVCTRICKDGSKLHHIPGLKSLSIKASLAALEGLAEFGNHLTFLHIDIACSNTRQWAPFWDSLCALHVLECLELNLDAGSSSQWSSTSARLPSSLITLRMRDFDYIPWPAISQLARLRVLHLTHCSSPEQGSFVEYLPRHLRELVMTGTHRWCVKWGPAEWVCLPPLLQNAPTLESARNGVIQFL